jgi:ribonuclease HII
MNFKYEKQKIKKGFSFVIGCDEVGRGCLAGPVVAAAVILNLGCKIYDLRGVNDSKVLKSEVREKLDEVIKENSIAWGVGIVGHRVVDKINIHNASLLAMRKAVESLLDKNKGAIPEFLSASEKISGIQKQVVAGPRRSDALARDGSQTLLVIDGKFIIPNFNIQQEAVIGGDGKVLSIAAASIIAKVYRDNLMKAFDKHYPLYKLAKHKGYATLEHRTAIKEFGLSPLHRLSFCSQYS